jgi:hypothetical protein
LPRLPDHLVAMHGFWRAANSPKKTNVLGGSRGDSGVRPSSGHGLVHKSWDKGALFAAACRTLMQGSLALKLGSLACQSRRLHVERCGERSEAWVLARVGKG